MRSAILVIVLFTIPVVSYSAVIEVPKDYNTIQAAIDVAAKGDTVLVAPGTYVENIDFKGKAITVKSSGGAGVTVIDGNQMGSVVALGAADNAVLDGFSITNGLSSHCGGVSSYGNQLITNNFIFGNTATCCSGGIRCGGATYPCAVISNNIIFNNTVTHAGGGIRCLNTAAPLIINNTIFNNYAGQGGGIESRLNTQPTVVNTILWGNEAPQGKEIYIDNDSIFTISNSDVKGGKSSTYVVSSATLNWKKGMIDANPLFVDVANDDFHLKQNPCQPGIVNSCVDAGDSSTSMIVGSTRTDHVQDTGIVDMGYHYPSTHYDYLNADNYVLYESLGGLVNLSLTAGISNAKRHYIILGSASGTTPGINLPGGFVVLPLNWDAFTGLVIDYINTSFLMNFLGALDHQGSGMAILNTAGPLPAGLAGTTLSFAFALNAPWDFVSNSVSIEIVP